MTETTQVQDNGKTVPVSIRATRTEFQTNLQVRDLAMSGMLTNCIEYVHHPVDHYPVFSHPLEEEPVEGYTMEECRVLVGRNSNFVIGTKKQDALKKARQILDQRAEVLYQTRIGLLREKEIVVPNNVKLYWVNNRVSPHLNTIPHFYEVGRNGNFIYLFDRWYVIVESDREESFIRLKKAMIALAAQPVA